MCCPYKQTVCEPMLQLSKSQYKDLCTECASKMMSGSGADMSFPATIADFTGTDVSFLTTARPDVGVWEPKPGFWFPHVCSFGCCARKQDRKGDQVQECRVY